MSRRTVGAGAVLNLVELEAWGRRLGRTAARWGGLVAMVGPLGSGKSTLVRAAAGAAGVEGPVQSPTYTLVREYLLPDGRTLFHADLYRIEDPAELRELGWERLLSASGPVFVEWADRATGWLPETRWEIRLDMGPDAEHRRAAIRAVGEAPAPPGPAGTEAAAGEGER